MISHSATSRFPAARTRAMTLIEMIVSIGILVIVILAVGLIFSGASNAVGTSQKTLDILSNVRAVQWQIEHDVAGMDKNCFLVIRSSWGSAWSNTFIYQTGSHVTYNNKGYVSTINGNLNNTPGAGNAWVLDYDRCDLVSFISYGSFPHRTGCTATGTNPFNDVHTVSPSAFITWGQLVMEKATVPANSDYFPSDQKTPTVIDQTYTIPLNQGPTGVYATPNGATAGGMTLGRNAMLLAPQGTNNVSNMAPAGDSVAAYQNHTAVNNGTSGSAIDYLYPAALRPVANGNTDGTLVADITQSRVDLAATTPQDIMAHLQQAIGGSRGTFPRFEADHFCYRHGAVTNVYDGAASNPINGYFRMHPIALQGVTSFAMEWSDGVSTYGAADIDPITGTTVNASYVGTTKWFGPNNPKAAVAAGTNVVDPTTFSFNPANNADTYCAIFSYDTPRASWPAALRFRIHVEDPTGRLQGGRDFVQIVKLPN